MRLGEQLNLREKNSCRVQFFSENSYV
eukprot:COSAG02_NODE_1652_length_11493_cov_82.045111_5_plen_26_part_01